MVIKYTNPYNEEKQNLMRQYSKTSDDTLLPKIAELDKKAKEFTEERLGKIQENIESVREEKDEVMESEELKGWKKYQELIRLYREATGLAQEISEIKKEMREELNKK